MITPAAPGPALLGIETTGDPAMAMPWTYGGLPAIAFAGGPVAPRDCRSASSWSVDPALTRLWWPSRRNSSSSSRGWRTDADETIGGEGMSKFDQVKATAKFAGSLYREKAAASVRRLPPWRPQHPALPAGGPQGPVRDLRRHAGRYADASHPLGQLVHDELRVCTRYSATGGWAYVPSRKRGQDESLSFLERNPPDHTRLRRLASPAFSKSHGDVRPRIEKAVHRLVDDLERRALDGDGTFDLVRLRLAPADPGHHRPARHAGRRSEAFAPYGAALGGALDGVRSLDTRVSCTPTRELERLFADLFELAGASRATTW